MRHIQETYASVGADTDGFGNEVTGASFTLSATSISGSDCAHKVTVLNNTATDHSGKTIALVGTDANGNPLTETLTGPGNGATVTSSGYFKTLTSATPSATIGTDTFDIGWSAAAVSPSIRVATRPTNFATAIGIGVQVNSSSAYSLQETFGSAWFTHATITGKTADFSGSILYPVQALRLIFTAASNVTIDALIAGE